MVLGVALGLATGCDDDGGTASGAVRQQQGLTFGSDASLRSGGGSEAAENESPVETRYRIGPALRDDAGRLSRLQGTLTNKLLGTTVACELDLHQSSLQRISDSVLRADAGLKQAYREFQRFRNSVADAVAGTPTHYRLTICRFLLDEVLTDVSESSYTYSFHDESGIEYGVIDTDGLISCAVGEAAQIPEYGICGETAVLGDEVNSDDSRHVVSTRWLLSCEGPGVARLHVVHNYGDAVFSVRRDGVYQLVEFNVQMEFVVGSFRQR